MAWTADEDQRRRRRQRLVRGLLLGGAALGLPALANVLIARRARSLPAPRWRDSEVYEWRHGHVHLRRLGVGPPILLLHSFGPGYSGLEWRKAAELLARRHEVVVPDLLGWGDSDRPKLAYDAELFVELIADLLLDVVGRRAVVAAAGLPAALATQAAVDHPELVRALVLVSPLGAGQHADEPDLKDAVLHRFLRLPIFGTSALNLFTSRNSITNHLRREVFFDPAAADEELIAACYRSSHLPGAQGALAAYWAGYLDFPIEPLLPRVEQPVWLAFGRHGRMPPVETADLWLHGLASAELQVFETAAQKPHYEVPEEWTESVLAFLGGLRS